MVDKMTFITPPFESQSFLTQDNPECTRLYWDSTYLDRIDLDRLDANPDNDISYDGTIKAVRERYPHVLPLFALWEYIFKEWALDSWTKPNGGQQTVADGCGLNNRGRYNREGSYRKWDQSTYAVLDTSYLKVCKSFQYIGSKLLYGQNTLEFATGNLNCGDSPAGLIAERGNTKGWVRSVNKAISCIKTQSNLKELPAWAWCDPFVSFLFTIGPDNSAEIQRLNFIGRVKSHSSIRYTDYREDLVQTWGENNILNDENDGKCLTAFEKSLAMALETEFRELRVGCIRSAILALLKEVRLLLQSQPWTGLSTGGEFWIILINTPWALTVCNQSNQS
ncbi:hypothetical protein BOTNAR_0753g00010 [Botryotinia narcissicola]|uniref:Uncharacterized protein n=1 Tax=Botryotinia narcissicola TaxID=278944 RepID=A0A4Z1H7D9_9HELO|nr:hypothetical protein BOTNAR_0753g00010 [Botryotinia narcissicola]